MVLTNCLGLGFNLFIRGVGPLREHQTHKHPQKPLLPLIKLLTPPLNPNFIYAIKQGGIKQEKPHPKLHTKVQPIYKGGLEQSQTE